MAFNILENPFLQSAQADYMPERARRWSQYQQSRSPVDEQRFNTYPRYAPTVTDMPINLPNMQRAIPPMPGVGDIIRNRLEGLEEPYSRFSDYITRGSDAIENRRGQQFKNLDSLYEALSESYGMKPRTATFSRKKPRTVTFSRKKAPTKRSFFELFNRLANSPI